MKSLSGYLETLHRIKSSNRNRGHTYWPIDRNDAWEYFTNYKKISRRIQNKIKERKALGTKFNHIDICGEAMFDEEDVLSSSFTYNHEFREFERGNGGVRYSGNILLMGSDSHFDKFVKSALKNPIRYDLMTFELKGGLGEVNPEFTSQELNFSQKEVENRMFLTFVRRLIRLSHLLNPEGYIYLGHSYTYSKYFEKIFVNPDILTKFGLKVVESGGGKTKVFLLQKVAAAS